MPTVSCHFVTDKSKSGHRAIYFEVMKMKESCGNCIYFFPISTFQDKNGEAQVAGECRRMPPSIVVMHDDNGNQDLKSRWPGILAFKWCGEWEEGDWPGEERLRDV